MAYIYGSHGRDGIAPPCAGRTDILLRIALPLLFLFALASAGLHAFLHGGYVITALFAIFFVFLLLRFEELGLTLALRLSGADAAARANGIVARTLRLLPEGYHVFHGLEFDGVRIDHAVVGPGGFFLIAVQSNIGRITEAREALRLNGWPFLGDLIGRSWRQSRALLRRLDLENSGAVQVCPVLCFSRGSVETGRLVRGVMVAQASTLVRMILEHESPLSSEKVLQLTDKLAPLVRDGTTEPEATHRDALDGMDDGLSGATAQRPTCSKCRHTPSDLEAHLFPNECPRCGRLYAHGHAEEPTALASPRTSAAAVAATCLIIAAGSALLAYQAGLFDQDSPVTIQAAEDADNTSQQAAEVSLAPAAPTATPPQTTRPSSATQVAEKAAGPAEAHVLEPENQTPDASDSVQSVNADDRESHASPSPSEPVRESAAIAPVGDVNATAGTQTQPAPAEPKNLTPAEGILTIVTARPTTLVLTNDQTSKRFGPYETRPSKALDIVLPKGCYSVVLVDSGRRRQTTVSFLGDTGRLEF
ncbi:nuclease-related domain-containing protein [Desulfomicrobium escambiense]|uniref:nuclease-related domain-containing protein n=1 Tax=Desulfomicrobium escambiense TaxID=29503 RepID=UPI00040D018E|nr:nuclease-related domain-containing protein [Desulfomicrobium escambiense]